MFAPEGLSAGDGDGPGCLEPGRLPLSGTQRRHAELKGERVWCEKDLSLKSSGLFGTSVGRE